MKETISLFIKDKENAIDLSMCERKTFADFSYIGTPSEDGEMRFVNLNEIEIFRYQHDALGGGTTAGDCITAFDLSSIASGLTDVLDAKLPSFEHLCKNPTFVIGGAVKVRALVAQEDGRFCFELSVADPYEPRFTTVRKENIPYEEMKRYVDVFVLWKNQYPILDEAVSIAFTQAYNSICNMHCDGLEALFNQAVQDWLEKRPMELERHVNRINELIRSCIDRTEAGKMIGSYLKENTVQ